MLHRSALALVELAKLEEFRPDLVLVFPLCRGRRQDEAAVSELEAVQESALAEVD